MTKKLSGIGEKEAIRRLAGFLDIGDDAAYIKHGSEYLILTTDAINQKTHIPKEMSPEQMGKFIVSINISDIAAMGAKPLAFLLACCVPDMEYSVFEDIIKSAEKQCRRYGADLVGGDTKENPTLTLAGFCLGTAKKPVLRSGARKGDIIAVTGKLGDAGLGFDLLYRGVEHRLKKRLVKEALEPEPRVNEGLLLSRHASSMTDITDSLAMSLHDLSKASGEGMALDIGRIPVSSGTIKTTEDLGLSILDYSLYSGGDYELLFTIKKKDYERVRDSIDCTAIGEVKGRGVTGLEKGRTFEIERRGYEHFRRI